MKIYFSLFFLFLLFSEVIQAQSFHNKNIITPTGDTINKSGPDGLFQGYHIYTDNDDNIISDSNAYNVGYFDKGAPIGIWEEHQADGMYAKGCFEIGSLYLMDSTQKYSTIRNGTGAKKGVWQYYNKHDVLIKEVLHETIIGKKYTIVKETTLDVKKGNIETYKKTYYHTGWKGLCKVIREYRHNPYSGKLTYKSHRNKWREKEKIYRSNGKLKEYTYYNEITQRYVDIRYSMRGERTRKTVEKNYNYKGQGCAMFR